MMMKRVERVARKVAPCNGERESEVREWLRAVETSGMSETETVLLAKETARGKLFREMVRQKLNTWRDIKQGVQGVFLAHNHAALLRQALHRVRQDPRESLRQFNLRFRELIDEAFGSIMAPAEEEHAVNAYLAALTSDAVADRVLEDGRVPSTLAAAIGKASARERIEEMKRAAGRRTRTDSVQAVMEQPGGEEKDADLSAKVEALTLAVASLVAAKAGGAPCGYCGKMGHPEAKCWAKHGRPGAGGQSAGAPMATGEPRRPKLRWTDDGQPICASCGGIGHLRRDCPSAAHTLTPKN